MTTVRAVALLSGGLDSALAAALVRLQGVEILGLHFASPTACRGDVREVASSLGIPLVVREKGDEYLALLRRPKFGYGRNMNPCIDCRSFMFQRGRALLAEHEAQFLVTGEVLGQRPMSQTRSAIDRIDRDADVRGLVLRPLSAQLLPPTLPEREGWVSRDAMHAISGRGRHAQLALAEALGVRRFESPGGGCLLTDAGFSDKLRDYFTHVEEPATRMDDVALLSVGRHLRVSPRLKLIVGRRADENERLARESLDGRWLVAPVGFNGSSVLGCGPLDDDGLAAALDQILRHSRSAQPHDQVVVRTREGEQLRRLHETLRSGAPGDSWTTPSTVESLGAEVVTERTP